jgi:hypothetical protein
MAERIRVGICVPTVRGESIQGFLDAWTPFWIGRDDSPLDVTVFVHEDHPDSTVDLSRSGLSLVHTTQRDICATLGGREWIIPRGSGACRSFVMYEAWRAGCEYVITLDDDCHPHADDGKAFIASHLDAFRQDRWFRTISGDQPRGIPYEHVGHLRVGLNHGLWSEVPDLDGPTALVRKREPRHVTLRTGHEVVPPGMAFPLCAMNVCYHRSVIPAAYNLLMGLEATGLDRFDDIWSGLLLKRVLDYMGWYATTGEPFVRHIKRSDYFTNLRKEALGIHIHEHLWDYILDAPLEPGLTVAGAFVALAEHVCRFPERFPDVPCQDGYFARLGNAMVTWTELFAEDGSTLNARLAQALR